MKPFVVYNPVAGAGRSAQNWPEIRRLLEAAIGAYDYAETTGRGDTPHLVRAALKAGPRLVVAVGGDGTVSEAVDGMFDASRSIPAGASLAFVATGTGDDFRKSFGWSGDFRHDIARIGAGGTRRIDIGRITCLASGGPKLRHFNNIAGFGLSGATSSAVNRATWSRMLGPKALFKLKSITALLRFRLQRVRVEIDNAFDETLDVALVAVANGAWFGGGMKVAPAARVDDGLFEIVIAGNCTKRQLFDALNQVYDGSHLRNPAVKILRGLRLKATPLDEDRTGPVLLDVDGEAPGRLPATFDMLPGVLTLRG